MDPSQVCFYRIPVALSVPQSPVVMAFAEARLGAVSGRGCGDGSGPALAMRRSTSYGASWGETQWIANDTQPEHEKLKDGIVLGVSLYDPASESAFIFYTGEWKSFLDRPRAVAASLIGLVRSLLQEMRVHHYVRASKLRQRPELEQAC